MWGTGRGINDGIGQTTPQLREPMISKFFTRIPLIAYRLQFYAVAENQASGFPEPLARALSWIGGPPGKSIILP